MGNRWPGYSLAWSFAGLVIRWPGHRSLEILCPEAFGTSTQAILGGGELAKLNHRRCPIVWPINFSLLGRGFASEPVFRFIDNPISSLV